MTLYSFFVNMLKACEGQKKVGSVKANCDTAIVVESYIILFLHNYTKIMTFFSCTCSLFLLQTASDSYYSVSVWVFTRTCVEVHTGQ